MPGSEPAQSEPKPVPVRLRGHHFLCILTYRGEGYSAEFVSNMTRVVRQIEAGAQVQLVSGPDDICAALSAQCRLDADHDCACADYATLDDLAIIDVEKCLGRRLNQPTPLTPADIATLRAAYVTGSIRSACQTCRWKPLCDDVAAQDFGGTVLP